MSSANRPQRFGDLEPSKWPGERLGLPETGPRSVARIGRRFAAIFIDWALAMLIGLAFAPFESSSNTWTTYVAFLVMQVVFIPTIGGSIGHRLLGMRVASLSGEWVGFWQPAVRTALLGLVIPLLVWDSDQRGFHDKVAGTVLIRA